MTDRFPIAAFPKIVCLCGSTRFKAAFEKAMLEETLAGRIVLTVGSMTHSDAELGARITPEVKERLDVLHKRKIDLASEILVLNVDDYIGESTMSEIHYAINGCKRIRFLEKYPTVEPQIGIDQTFKSMTPALAARLGRLGST